MVYRLSQLEIPQGDPFKFDALNRRPMVKFLAGLIENTGGPFVLALDSPWGTGKTTLVQMLKAELELKHYACLYFNAWQVDYVTDPLIALVSSIDRIELDVEGKVKASIKGHMKIVRRVTSIVAKRTAVAAAKVLTAGVLDLDGEIEDAAAEFAGDSVSDVVELFQKETVLLAKFKSELEAVIKKLPDANKKSTLVFFVDEIDRCRPTFSIELLERIKHLFDIPNILFVLSLDKQQLEASTAAVYGPNINSAEYLRRFIDLEYAIPVVKTKQFVESLFLRFGLNDIFAQRTANYELKFDRQNFIDFFSSLAEALSLTLRAQERCITRLRVVMDQTPNNHYLEPVLVALLIVLKAKNPNLFGRMCRGDATAKDVMSYLYDLPNGKEIFSGRDGVLIEAYLIASDDNLDRKGNLIGELSAWINNQEVKENKDRALQLIQMINTISKGMRDISFSHVSRKVDLAAWIKD
ncbi:MAG: P-loop NTPase fold protein [Gallionellaceae bacterium]|jgi:broad-specificity NMP kinase